MKRVRPPAVAGRFYPGDRAELEAAVRGYLSAVKVPAVKAPAVEARDVEAGGGADAAVEAGSTPKAVIAPHAGYIYSGPIAASAYARIARAPGAIRRVVLLGPAHRVAIRGLAAPEADAFATPMGEVPLDRDSLQRALELPQVRVFDAAHALEHSLEVQLPFLQSILDDFVLVPLVVGDASPEAVAEVLDRLWGGEETLIVVSTDLSHYNEYATAQRLDAATSEAIEALALDRIETDHACGRIPVQGLLRVAQRRGMQAWAIDVRNSGDTAGPRDSVVGYGAYALA